ncbi:hypothetical protein A5M85_03730 [Cellulophaga lytica]|uniref:hypothetical protein n=1 Tax=Cellulophaga lytica TaxID=979 RepID=UPI0009508BD3|nr:hypothetical protein [Cellulophaga lytica]APU09422.1 hypothetical protein A5M85_03730 [Cellulophaga lytica]
MLEEEFDIDALKRNETADFVAEVFYEELKFILNKDLDQMLIVENNGMNSRALSKDILDVSTLYKSISSKYKEFLVLHLSRNSIYHQLPEILFHPLVISTPSMSNREVVEAIKENKRRELRNLNFFQPFDTDLFNESSKIINRHLNFLTDDDASENLFKIAQKILDAKLDIPKVKLFKLFFKLCNSEQLKENLPVIEDLIYEVLDLKVTLKYTPKIFNKIPFNTLGNGLLGIDFGLHGNVQSEVDDITVCILLNESVEDYNELLKNINNVKIILSFLIISNREIFVTYHLTGKLDFTLNNKYLGYDTYLN